MDVGCTDDELVRDGFHARVIAAQLLRR
jgi:hypothetical protein